MLPLNLFLMFTLILFLRPQELFPWVGVIPLAKVSAGGALLSYLFQRPGAFVSLLKEKESKILIGLLVWTIFTLPFSLWPGGSVKAFFEGFFQAFVAYFLIIGIVDSYEKVRKVIWVITISIGVYALFGLIDYIQGKNLVFGRLGGRAQGLYGNPNDLAITLSLIIPFVFSLIKNKRDAKKRLFLYGTIAVSLATIVLTYSRTGIITLGIVFFGFLAKSKKKFRVASIVAMVTIVLVSLGGERLVDRSASIFDDSKDEVGSRQSRIDLLETGIQSFWENPIIGVGLGNFYNMEGASWHVAHNGYIEIAVELGILGLVLFLGLMYVTFLNLRRIQKLFPTQGTLSNEYYLCQFLEISLWTYFAALMFSSLPFAWPFFYLLGISVSTRRWLSSEITAQQETSGFGKR